MSARLVEVSVRVYGTFKAFGESNIRIISVPPTVEEAVVRVKNLLYENGFSRPYVLYLNDVFVKKQLTDIGMDRIASGDEFKVIPIFSGG